MAAAVAAQGAPASGRVRAGNGYVHIQAPSPAEILRQHAAEQESNRCATTGDRPVQGERPGPLVWLREGHSQKGEGGGREQRRESALRRTRGQQHSKRSCGSTHG